LPAVTPDRATDFLGLKVGAVWVSDIDRVSFQGRIRGARAHSHGTL
jgi:hypothetical protein